MKIRKIICLVLSLVLLSAAFCTSVVAEESKICDIFPDKNLAAAVAEALGKSVTDSVTNEELATVEKIGGIATGPFDIGEITSAIEVSSLKGVEKLTGLKILCVTGRSIKTADEVADLTKLEVLSICSADLSKIPPVGKLTELKYLFLNDNNITKIEGLDNQKKLLWLYLDDNFIKWVDCIDKCEKLRGISLDGNHMTDIYWLHNIKNPVLRFIDLNRNNVSSLMALKGLKITAEYGTPSTINLVKQTAYDKRILDPEDSNILTVQSMVDLFYSTGEKLGIIGGYGAGNNKIDIEIPNENTGEIEYRCKIGGISSGFSLAYNITVTQRWMRGFSKYDVDNNGIADVNDIISLKAQIMSDSTDIKHDIDNDGEVTVNDITALKSFILDWRITE